VFYMFFLTSYYEFWNTNYEFWNTILRFYYEFWNTILNYLRVPYCISRNKYLYLCKTLIIRLMKTEKQKRNNGVVISNKNLIQSYIMTTAKYDFSVYEKRILYLLVEMAQCEVEGRKFPRLLLYLMFV
jgi:phosphate starvation-inducible membrane PsiE